MRNILKSFIALGCMVVASSAIAAQAPLTGNVMVNVTSSTAAAAKNQAMAQARRQIVANVLAPYAMADMLAPAVADSTDSDLIHVIASTSIDGEQSSDTTYSANITMTLDRDAARAWMNDKNVQNWLTDGVGGDMFTMNIAINDKVSDMAAINKIARDEKVDLTILSISGKNVVAVLPAANRTGITIALRDSGWRTADADGVLMVTK